MSKEFNIWLQFFLLFLSAISFFIAGKYEEKREGDYILVFAVIIGITLMITVSNL